MLNKHYMKNPTMIGYIHDQGSIFRYCLDHIDMYEKVAKEICKNDYKKIYLVGSGSSYHAAVVSKYYFTKILNIETHYIMPNLFTYHECVNTQNLYSNKDILVIGISQSGNSLTTLSSLQRAKELGCSTLAITEDINSRITKAGYPVLQLLCKYEDVSPETKGYSCTLMTCYLLVLNMAKQYGKLSCAQFNEKIEEAKDFANYFDNYVQEATTWYEKNKEEILNAKKIGITGFGLNYGTAIEAQLKIFECTHLPAVGYETEEFIHGHIFAYDNDNYLFTIAAEGEEIKRMDRMNSFYKENITKHIFVITSENNNIDEKDLSLSKKYCEELMSIAYVVPFQIIAYYIATNLGMTTQHFPMTKLDWPARD